ncbi:hypothetical protein EJ08DRAFT_660972 [Tothia fuscella]|uniref:MARVEL domain-containing protein n=1 Tax=Tothia fuscella TaxID=1048955 RepID=A0A9P4NQJ9_9PEZI|nr:hypothetical protein EJ08DRAFT_660972 [Tothia fuscella]
MAFKIIPTTLRAFQLLFSIIVLGLSISLIKGQHVGGAPIRQGYSAFAGALGMVAAIYGLVVVFVESLAFGGIVSWAVDGFTSLALLAGGIIMALGLRGTKCGDQYTLYKNELIAGGNVPWKSGTAGYYHGDPAMLKKRCTQNTAEVSFEFLACIFFVITLGWSMFNRNKSSTIYGV